MLRQSPHHASKMMRSWQVSIGRDASPKASCWESIQISVLSTAMLKPSELCKGKVFETNLAQCEWNGWICLYFPPFMLLFAQFAAEMLMWLIPGCFLRLGGFYIIHGAIGLNILDNVWTLFSIFKITPYSALQHLWPWDFWKGLYTYKSSIGFVIVIS